MIWTHVSELAIDRLLAGEVEPTDAAAMRSHAVDCAHCGALLDDALACQREFAADRPVLGLPVPISSARRGRSMVIAGATALAAALAVVIAWPRSATHVLEVRTKGTAIIGFYVAHGDAVRRGTLREPVIPGDRIELFTTTSATAWVAIVGDDAAGHHSVYVAPRAIDAGSEQLLPLSIQLDDTLGDEVVTAMFCPEQFDPQSPPSECTTDHFTLAKVGR